MSADDLLSVDELAERLHVSAAWIRSRAHLLPCTINWSTGEIRIRRGDLEVWAQALEAPRRPVVMRR